MSAAAAQVELGRLSARLEARVGLRPPAWMLADRAAARARALGRDLVAHLQAALHDEDELDALAEALRIGETRFFRHGAQLEALRAALPARRDRCRGERRPLRAWSAGCATGEEAWTLAMLLAEAPPEGEEAPEVLGTDLSEAALRVAEAGAYPAAAAAPVPPPLAARFLRPAGAQVEISDALRAAARVRFARHNLLDERYPGPFDVILCRNVLIYFEEARQRRVVERLRGRLEPGGALLLGPSEQHLLPGAAPPARAALPEDSRPPLPASTAAVGAPAGARARVGGDPGEPEVVKLRGSYGDGERLRRELQPHLGVGPTPLLIDLDGADYLGDADGRVLRRAAEVRPLRLRAEKPAVRRWLRRQRLDGEEG